MFEPPKAGVLYKDLFPLAWKVVKMQERGVAEGIATWNAYTAFFIPSVEAGNLIHAANYASCATGQECTVTSDGDLSTVTDAVGGTPNVLKCKNLTGTPADIGIGFTDEDGENIQVALMWTGVANKESVVAQLTPVLQVYAARDYKQTEIIRGEIDGPLLWSGNLMALKEETVFKVSVDATSGEIKVVPQ